MRTTVFRLKGGVVFDVKEIPEWKPFEEYDAKPLDRVSLVELLSVPGGEIQLVEIKAGGSFAMHSSPDVAFCQVVKGRGRLGLPDGTELAYEAPELYVFLPDTEHDWRTITEDTLLSVCLVRQG
ncbi:MAG: cupin domain-containing protein [Acidimicrobiia bacterium]